MGPDVGPSNGISTEASIVHHLEPPMNCHSVFLKGSWMAKTTEILMEHLTEHRMARLTEFHLECTTGRQWGQMLDLPMASATEASMVHHLEPPMETSTTPLNLGSFVITFVFVVTASGQW